MQWGLEKIIRAARAHARALLAAAAAAR